MDPVAGSGKRADYILHAGPDIDTRQQEEIIRTSVNAIRAFCSRNMLYWCVVGVGWEGFNLTMRVFSSGLVESWPRRIRGIPAPADISPYFGRQEQAQHDLANLDCGYFYVRGPREPPRDVEV